MADLDTYETEPRTYEDDRDYTRERSRSPGPDRDGDSRLRDEPMNGRGDRDGPSSRQNGGGEDAVNPGSNLFVTGIHPRLSEEEVAALFEKYGAVEKCNIMRDPHTRESRGFGFVKMVTSDGADAAKDALQGETYEGRTLSIEKARRARPRTPTPGKYFGPPKRGPPGRPGAREDSYYDRAPRGGGYRDRYDDRGGSRRGGDDFRRGGGGGGGYRDRYDDRRYEDRGYGGRSNDEYQSRGDRYASSRDDRYGDRRGGGGGGGAGGAGGATGSGSGGYSYDRAPRGAPAAERTGYGGEAGGSGAAPPRDYDDRRRYD